MESLPDFKAAAVIVSPRPPAPRRKHARVELLGVQEVAGDDREQRLNPQHYDVTRSERGRVGQVLLLPVNPAEAFTVRMEGKLGNQRSARWRSKI